MSLRELAALMRRHVLAVAVVLVLAVGVGYALKHVRPLYQESSTVILVIPPSAENPNPYNSFGDSLVDTGQLLSTTVMSTSSQQALRASGATGAFDVAPVNLYNEEYPYYQSYLTVTASSTDPVSAHQTFLIVAKAVTSDLAAAQAKQGVAPRDRITGNTIGDTGPIIQKGSSKREYGIFAVLVIIVVLTVSLFFDRHPFRLGRVVSLGGLSRGGSVRPNEIK